MEFLDEIINMRVKPSQKEMLQAKANKEGLSVSTYCRVKLVKGLDNQMSKSSNVARLKQLRNWYSAEFKKGKGKQSGKKWKERNKRKKLAENFYN